MKSPHKTIVRALITEKGTKLREKGNKYVFQVATEANKIEIKQAIQKIFSVHVEEVRTMNVVGQGEATRPPRGPSARLEEGHRHPQGGRSHRALRAGLKPAAAGAVPRRPPGENHGNQKVSAVDAEPTVQDGRPTSRRSRARSRKRACWPPLRSSGGRDNQGHVSSWHRGGGHKRRYRIVDFRRDKRGIPAKVDSIEYDPNRTARIALLVYADGEKRYIMAPDGLKVGDRLEAGTGGRNPRRQRHAAARRPAGHQRPQPGDDPGQGRPDRARRRRRPVSWWPRKGARPGQAALGRSADVPPDCYCTIGQVGNLDHENIVIGKAGRSRWLGRRPHNRGVAMNPRRSPDGRRRRPHLGRAASLHAVGQADQGLQDAQEEAVGPSDRPASEASSSQSDGERDHGTFDQKGSVRRPQADGERSRR